VNSDPATPADLPPKPPPGQQAARRRRWFRRKLFWLLNLYPPYLGAGVRVTHISPDLRRFDVTMPLRFYNRNYVGTHFGGSLYSMCDPFYMLIVFEALGDGYVVWDKAASIRFVRPGRGRVRARFEVADEEIERIRREVAAKGVCEPTFTAEVLDSRDRVVATVEKLLYVRRKLAETGSPR
jgi:acyl-coenzyme A thioesterase PaaI-like protein